MLLEELRRNGVELVCLAGFMRLLSASFIRAYPNRILNIHPSLLPAFPGLDAQHQALEHGVKITGCTVHFVDEYLDAGPIIIQTAVPVMDDDTVETLSARILKEEHRIYSEAIRSCSAGTTGSKAGASLGSDEGVAPWPPRASLQECGELHGRSRTGGHLALDGLWYWRKISRRRRRSRRQSSISSRRSISHG